LAAPSKELPNNIRSKNLVSLFVLRARRAEKSPGMPPPIVALLALAETMAAELKAGRKRSELAVVHGLTRARVTQLLDLLRLHPDILAQVRALPPGAPPRRVTERKLRRLVRLPAETQLEVARRLFPRPGNWATRAQGS
jgi:hypothetical protein